jgi:small subunit ribosomal protein S16
LATKIRLKRMGAKKRPFYRIVAIDSRKPATGPYLDNLGNYNPIEKPARVTADEEKIFKWLDDGAQLSDTVESLFRQIGLMQKYEAKKAGQDVGEMEVKTTITERPKKRKKKKQAE